MVRGQAAEAASASAQALPAPARRLAELAEAFPFRVTGAEVRRMIRWLRRRAGWAPEKYSRLWSDPEASFGPFGALPVRLRETLADGVIWEMREKSFTTGERIHRRVYGPLFRLGSEISLRGRLTQRPWTALAPARPLDLPVRSMAVRGERAGRTWVAGGLALCGSLAPIGLPRAVEVGREWTPCTPASSTCGASPVIPA